MRLRSRRRNLLPGTVVGHATHVGRLTTVLVEHTAVVSAATTATTSASATREIALAVARIPAIRRIAVEVAPVAFATIATTPSSRGKYGKDTAQRPAMPSSAVAARAARIGTRIAAGTAAGATARTAAADVATRIAVVAGYRTPGRVGRSPHRTPHWPTGCTSWPTAIAAAFIDHRRAALPAAHARAVAENGLEQPTARVCGE